MQGLDDLCGQCESLPLIAVVFPAYNPSVTPQLKLPAALIQTLDRLISLIKGSGEIHSTQIMTNRHT